jgi:hypothetical protein
VRYFTYLLLFIGISGLFAPSANAAQSLSFGAKISDASRLALDGYLRASLGQSPETLEIAPIDLNNDGLSEFILREKNCSTCRFLVLAETDGVIVPLGEAQGHTLKIDDAAKAGVRSLLVYTNSANDYEYAVYVWEPGARRYIMAKNE